MSFPNLTDARQTELIAWGTVTLSLSFLGAVNNLLVLLVTWPGAGSKFGLNLLIFHFVAVNLFMCLMGIPISVILILLKRDGYFIPPNICNFFQAVYGLGATLVNWSDSMLAVNRCLALFVPHHYLSLTKQSANLAVLVFMWAIGLAGMLPMSFGVGGQLRLSDLGQCGTFPAAGRLGMFLMSLVSYFPFSVTGTGALLILLKMSGMARHRVVSHVGAGANNGGAGAVRGRKVILRHLKKMAKNPSLDISVECFLQHAVGRDGGGVPLAVSTESRGYTVAANVFHLPVRLHPVHFAAGKRGVARKINADNEAENRASLRCRAIQLPCC
ncbi:hypothetical protein BV898_03410 [Hypsibius exemplaris]|uniref:G-protein coupled receptors family 1 profile domain-containing protein n=1 Tax=Hypsibius exemplaris TaxID=2072580 RepID=A0A1W0X4Z9_HYPEX|nr:hypothetical protein BV898_03410 [Hypsibius exemplaris]